jgi:LAS superfamily LD-carboxypeptidase LdcB
MAYREGIGENGKLSNSVLKSVGGKHMLFITAADSYLRMQEAAKQSGVNFNLVSSYRKCGRKGDYTERNCADGATQWCLWEKYKAGKNPVAANPSTSKGCKSNHGYGLAIDLYPKSAQDWVKKNGEKYGWMWDEGKSIGEDWHFRYSPGNDTMNQNTLSSDRYKNIAIVLGITAFAYGLWYFTRPKSK